MPPVVMIKLANGDFRPATEHDRDITAKIPVQREVTATIKQERYPEHTKKYWALIDLIWENQTRYLTPTDLSNDLKVIVGHCHDTKRLDGSIVTVPHSIAEGAMDQLEFNEFWDKIMHVCITHIVPGLRREDVESEVADKIAGFFVDKRYSEYQR